MALECMVCVFRVTAKLLGLKMLYNFSFSAGTKLVHIHAEIKA